MFSKKTLKTVVQNDEFNKLVVPTSGGIRLIHLETIARMESDNNYTNIYLEAEPKLLLISKTLKHFERALESSGFLRVHQSHLINATKIVDYDTEGGGVLRLSNKYEVLVSRSKRSMIKDYIHGNNLGV